LTSPSKGGMMIQARRATADLAPSIHPHAGAACTHVSGGECAATALYSPSPWSSGFRCRARLVSKSPTVTRMPSRRPQTRLAVLVGEHFQSPKLAMLVCIISPLHKERLQKGPGMLSLDARTCYNKIFWRCNIADPYYNQSRLRVG
jgi:hypothetical protein